MSKSERNFAFRRSGMPLGVLLLAIAAALSFPILVSTAIGALGDSAEPIPGEADSDPHHGYNATRDEVARGQSLLGAWVMYASTGPEGTCVDIELPDANPPGGARALYSECSEHEAAPVNPASLVGPAGTLVYGLAPPDTARVVLGDGVGGDLEARLHAPGTGDGSKFFIASTESAILDGSARAYDARDRLIGAKALP